MAVSGPTAQPRSWRWRMLVGACSLILVLAVGLVRFARLSRWRWTLGRMDRDPDAQPAQSGGRLDPHRAALLSGAIKQASALLPFEVKCLAQAVVMQWLMRAAALPSRLVIAFHKTDRVAVHGYHAWVEHGGRMVIGACDRAAYRPALAIVQGSRSAVAGAA